jgi:hypothetical protein
MSTEFDWFTGVANLEILCPSGIHSPEGLRPFFRSPNSSAWGTTLPRWLYHETLHFWQLSSSDYLQSLVLDEWQRLLAFERDGVPPPLSAKRQNFGKVVADEPFSVRDLIECTARFWDVHTRSPTQILREEGNDLGGQLRQIDEYREANGYSGAYNQVELDAVMDSGHDREIYAKPYQWMRDRTKFSQAILQLEDWAPTWAVNLLLPVASFLALNTQQPVKAFLTAFEAALSPEIIGVAARLRDPSHIINIDWLNSWPVLASLLTKVLVQSGLPPSLDLSLNVRKLDPHPVYKLLWLRFGALFISLSKNYDYYKDNPREFGQLKWSDQMMTLREAKLFNMLPMAVFSLPAQPTFRLYLGANFAPPLTRFQDAEIPATLSAFPDLYWTVTGEELSRSVKEVERRFALLHAADCAIKYNLPPNSFAAPNPN